MSYTSTKILLGSEFNVSPKLSEIRNCCLFLPYILYPVRICFNVRSLSMSKWEGFLSSLNISEHICPIQNQLIKVWYFLGVLMPDGEKPR